MGLPKNQQIFSNQKLTSMNTADCKSLATSKLNSWKTTIVCLNREEGHTEAGKIIRFIRSKSIVVFHCSACLAVNTGNQPSVGVTLVDN